MAYKVLLADDSVPAQNMGKKILMEAGYDVLTVSNGLEALRKIADTLPDIAILDIFMPGYTGLEICARLRSKAATAELPVILTVGKLEPYRREDGERVGSNAVIVKPFAAAELTAAVRSLIGVRRAEVVFSADNPPPANLAAPPQEELAPAGTDEPLLAGAPVVSAVESPQAQEPPPEEQGPASLVFNPDAAPTPFSASAVEASLAEMNVPAQADPPAISEFHLELEPSAQDSTESFPGGEPFESWHSEPDVTPSPATPALTHDAAPDQAAADAPMASPEPATLAAEPAAAEPALASIPEPAEGEEPPPCEEVMGPSLPAPEPDSSLREDLLLEPLPKTPAEMAQADAVAFDGHDGALPELILLDDAAAGDDEFTGEPLTSEQEARRQAFEDLFNSDVPFPLEEAAGPVCQLETVAPPCLAPSSLPESSTQRAGGIEMEPELARDDFYDSLMPPAADTDEILEVLEPAPAAEPEAPEAVEPATSADPLFEGEPQWEDISASSAASPATEPPPMENGSSPFGDSYTVQPDGISEPLPQFQTAAPAIEPAIPAAAVEAIPVEKQHPAPVASPERSELVAEVAKVEALLVQMQAVRQVGEPAGHAPGVAEFPQPEAVPADPQSSRPTSAAGSSTQMCGTAEVESAPLQAAEAAPVDLAAAPAPAETELPKAEAAPVRQEQPVEPELVSAPLETTPQELAHARAEAEASVDETSFAPTPEDGVNDSERIHQAVERVFDRFRPLLIAAIVRELVRRD